MSNLALLRSPACLPLAIVVGVVLLRILLITLAISRISASPIPSVVDYRFNRGTIGQPIVPPTNLGSDPDVVASIVTSNPCR